MTIYYIIIFCLGLFLGSFFNVVLARLDRKEGILFGRSECFHCHRRLKWLDLIPLLSFVILKRRCRYCHQRISYSYPLVESITAGLVLSFLVRNGLAFHKFDIFSLIMLIGFLLLGFFDLKYMILPDKIIIPMMVLALGYNFFWGTHGLIYALLTGFIMASLFAILHIASSGRWMGLGDAKMVFLMGLIFGYPMAIVVVMFSIWSAALVGLVLVGLKRATSKTALPLGTFLSAVSIVYIIFQNEFKIFSKFF